MSRWEQADAEVLAAALFAPAERWGWQYVDPGEPRPSPDLADAPLFVEPEPPDLAAIELRQAAAGAQVPGRLGAVAAVVVAGLLIATVAEGIGLLVFLAGVALAAAWFLPMAMAGRSVEALREKHEQEREAEIRRHRAAHEEWERRIALWERAEEALLSKADLWFPLVLRSAPRRVDVFGGTPDGWAALLCTAGSSLLASSEAVLVVDLTEEDVAGPLAELAAQQGFPVVEQRVPADLEVAGLLTGLGPAAVAQLVAEAADTLRRGGDDPGLRLLDVELVRGVVERLDGTVTFRRIAAGLLALQQGYDPDRDDRLSSREFRQLAELVDTVAATDRARDELQFLRGLLEMLPAAEGEPAPSPGTGGPWPRQGLVVLRTVDDDRRRRDLVDRLLTQVLLQNLRRARNGSGALVLVLAGADHLGSATLELLARRCRQAGVRLVLLLEHLRGDLRDLLGGPDSATFFMRLGNAEEAAAAAEHIGRGHTFLLTQLSRQRGRTDSVSSAGTTGVSTSTSASTTVSSGRTSRGWLEPPAYTRGSSSGTSVTTGESVSWSTGESRSDSTTDAETVSRVYEFTVEPTRIQSLDATSFVLVEPDEGERRVVAGVCDPYVATLSKVSSVPAARVLDDVED